MRGYPGAGERGRWSKECAGLTILAGLLASCGSGPAHGGGTPAAVPTSPPITTPVPVPPTPAWQSDACAGWIEGNVVDYGAAEQEYSEAATEAELGGDDAAEQDFTVLARDAAAVEDGSITVSAYDSDVSSYQQFFADC